ncbi:MAG: hypothetical protein IJS88_02600 [Alphaproteobacteria bacterium]|nr:hypothetical protein [Alphaproteobacteria bacterium]
MLESLIYFSPVTILLVALLVLMFGERDENNAYGCFRFSRTMLLLSFGLAVIFYNKSTIVGLTVGNKFTLLFDSLLYGSGLALLYPSRKWFVSMNFPAHIFCGCLFLCILSGSLLICSDNLALTAVCCSTMLIGNYIMLKQGDNKKETDLGNKVYMVTAICAMVLLAIATAILYEKNGSTAYSELRTMLAINKDDPLLFAAIGMFVTVFVLLLGMAPLHFCASEVLGKTILPVFMYFLLVPFSAVWGGFIRFNISIAEPIFGQLRLFYMSAALLSVGIGAIGACSGQNIRKIFAYSSVFYSGIIFLTIRKFTLNAVSSGFVYLILYMFAIYGICICLFGIKKKGDYLFMLSDFEGAAQKRPYISAMMLIFMLSLLGLPPFSGFIGLFASLNYLALHHHFYQLVYLLSMMAVIAYAYLQIIRVMYFVDKRTLFDKVDSGIHMAIFLNMILMIVITLQPQYLLTGFRSMLEVLFL